MSSGSLPSSHQVGRLLKGVLFDMDGTLVSTLTLIIHCTSQVAIKYLGKAPTFEEIVSSFRSGPASSLIEHLMGQITERSTRQAVEDYYDCYRENYQARALVFPGIPELLERLNNSGRHLAVVTGVERKLMDYSLEVFGLRSCFEALVSGEDVQSANPDPEGICLAIKRMGVGKTESIVVGDSPADIMAGRRAGVLTAAALWSPEGQGDPSRENPDYSFRSVQELAGFLLPERRDEDPGFYFARG